MQSAVPDRDALLKLREHDMIAAPAWKATLTIESTHASSMRGMDTLRIRVVLFDGFEPLDVCGPAEVLGYLGQMKNAPVSTNLQYISRHGDKVPLPVYLILACRRKY